MAVKTYAIEFSAEESKFLAGLKKIRAENKELGASFQSVARDANTLFGGALEQKARLSVEAIKQVGGAVKLTEAEVKKHLATLDQWIAKSKTLGREVPDSILSTRAALANVNTEATKTPGLFSSIGSKALGLGAAMGVAFSVGAVKTWVQSTLAAAGQIDDLSKKLGVSAESVQRWKFAAEQGGATIEHVDKAVTVMNKSLAEGDKSTIAALKSAGLSFDSIRKMKPEDAFNAITKAIGDIPDPMERARIAMELFGKGGAELLPAIVDGFAKVAAGADVMSNETVARLAAAEDAWARLGTKVTIVSGEIIAGTLATAEQATSSWRNFFEFLRAGASNVIFHNGSAPIDFDGLDKGANGPKKPEQTEADRQKAIEKAIQDALARAKAAAEEASATAKAKKAAEERLELDKKIAAAQIPLTAAQRTRIDQLLKIGLGESDIAKKLGISEIAVGKYTDALKKEADWLKKINELAREQIPLLKASADSLKNLPVNLSNPNSPTFAQKIPLQTLANETLPDDLIAALNREMSNINFALDDGAVKTHNFIASWAGLKHVSGEVETLTDKIQKIFKNVGLDAAHDLASSMADNIRTGDWSQFENQLSGTIFHALGSAAAKAIDLWIPGLGTALQPLFEALGEKLMGWLGLGTRGRDAVKDFAASFGGFDGLHKELNKLGAEGERLWINLTQGVGRNNPEEARKAIEAINKALNTSPEALASAAGFQTRDELQEIADKARKVYEFMRDSGKYSAEQIAAAFQKSKDAQIAAMNDVQRAAYNSNQKIVDDLKKQLDSLDTEYNSIFQSWAAEDAAPEFDEAGNRIFGVVELAQRARLDAIEEERKQIRKQLEDADEAMRQSMQNVADSVRDLVDVLRNELGGALDELGGRQVRIKVGFDVDDLPTPGEHTPAPASTGGYVTNSGISTQYRAFGGGIRNMFRPQGTDTVPAMLTPGEFVMNTRAVDVIGADVLAGLNSGRMTAMPAAAASSPRSASHTVAGDTYNLTVNGNVDSNDRAQQVVDDFVSQVRRGGRNETRVRGALRLEA